MENLNERNKEAYQKEAFRISWIAFWLYTLCLPYLFVVTVSSDFILFRSALETSWSEVIVDTVLVNTPLVTFLTCLILLGMFNYKKNYEKVLLVSVLPALSIVLSIDMDSFISVLCPGR